MRTAIRLLASVKPGRYLEAGNPTGLTGLFTHEAPRSALLYVYSSTLDKLKAFPESSAYRQSVEAITRHRLRIVEAIKPEGYEEWAGRAAKEIAAHPEVFNTLPGRGKNYQQSLHDGRKFILTTPQREEDERVEEWDGEKVSDQLEGPRTTAESKMEESLMKVNEGETKENIQLEPEPSLEISQLNDLETQIGAGLIEEVIQVAEGELLLIDTMVQSRVWEELEEKASPGQWDYFARDTHTPGTQEPPNK